MGEEWGASTPWMYFTDFEDRELGQAVSEGRRREFAAHGWDAEQVPDPQAHSTRDASVLLWGERDEPEHQRLLDWHRALVAERRRSKELTDGRLDAVQVDVADDESWLVVRRGALRLVCNLGRKTVSVPLDAMTAQTVLAFDPVARQVSDGSIDLDGHGVALLRVE